MAKLFCPHCGAPSFSVWQKLFLGPARSVTCDACGARASVPIWSMAMAIPVLIAVLIGFTVDAVAIRWSIIAIGFVATAYMHIAFVPLIRR